LIGAVILEIAKNRFQLINNLDKSEAQQQILQIVAETAITNAFQSITVPPRKTFDVGTKNRYGLALKHLDFSVRFNFV
jgi:hypothetical protein